MKIRDVMTKDIASIETNDDLQKAASLMEQHNVGSIPVCEQGRVVGIITDRDIALRSVAKGSDTKNVSVRSVMSSNPATVNPDADVNDAVRIMSERQIRRLPVVENNTLVGMVALGDIALEPALKNNAETALKNISEPCSPTIQ
ncbi:CBS domain-containing protein [Clostridium sp. 19966]|uniref:CBS domain-containing protein n=1 Tax=Clostridium sp. 19966 TaxID=2768166 RepID=UPI0028DFCF26|nr:CBS domain-containing protein [Clostridium sp. 19966]MDT8718519.1 CBS domain-containing protein [Clostridium sp. 19966]